MSHTPKDFTVWTEIPVTDLERATAFYNAVFETELNRIEDMGPDPIAMFPTSDKNGVAGHLYPGKPAPAGTGSTIHLQSPGDLDKARERVLEAGGAVVSEVITIPDGKFFYCQDPDGNSIGIFHR
ncbi:MAG: VOC family protein [Rhodospirillales bacterium]